MHSVGRGGNELTTEIVHGLTLLILHHSYYISPYPKK